MASAAGAEGRFIKSNDLSLVDWHKGEDTQPPRPGHIDATGRRLPPMGISSYFEVVHGDHHYEKLHSDVLA